MAGLATAAHDAQAIGCVTRLDATPGFRIAVSATSQPGTAAAMGVIIDEIRAHSPEPPDFVTLHYSSAHATATMQALAATGFAGAALHGGSSCLGVMTGQGAAIDGGAGLGALAIWDRAGAYGTARAPIGTDARSAAQGAVRRALMHAGRAGEAPGIVWLTTAPGHEESILQGIKDVLGPRVLIVGGSSADNDVSGAWSQLTEDGWGAGGMVVSVLFPSVPFGQLFESGYAPTRTRGRITQADGRSVVQIDGRPAG